jgi:hypothetical protein
MSERQKPHFGRDRDGHRKVRQEDVDDLITDPDGAKHMRDDVRLGGAVADTGLEGARRAKEIGEMVQGNREDVARVTGKTMS